MVLESIENTVGGRPRRTNNRNFRLYQSESDEESTEDEENKPKLYSLNINKQQQPKSNSSSNFLQVPQFKKPATPPLLSTLSHQKEVIISQGSTKNGSSIIIKKIIKETPNSNPTLPQPPIIHLVERDDSTSITPSSSSSSNDSNSSNNNSRLIRRPRIKKEVPFKLLSPIPSQDNSATTNNLEVLQVKKSSDLVKPLLQPNVPEEEEVEVEAETNENADTASKVGDDSYSIALNRTKRKSALAFVQNEVRLFEDTAILDHSKNDNFASDISFDSDENVEFEFTPKAKRRKTPRKGKNLS
jgi:hypothetical protein